MAKDNERSIVPPHIKNKAIQMLSPSFGNRPVMEVLAWINTHIDESTGSPLTVDRSTVFKWRKKAIQEFVHPIDKPIDWKNLNYLTSTTTIEKDGIDCEPLNIPHQNLGQIMRCAGWIQQNLRTIGSAPKKYWDEKFPDEKPKFVENNLGVVEYPKAEIKETYRFAYWCNIVMTYCGDSMPNPRDLYIVSKNFARRSRIPNHDMQDVWDWMTHRPWVSTDHAKNYIQLVKRGAIKTLFYNEIHLLSRLDKESSLTLLANMKQLEPHNNLFRTQPE